MCIHTPTAPSAPPTNVTVATVTSTSLLVAWQPPPPIHQNGIIVYYQVLYEPWNTFNGLIASSGSVLVYTNLSSTMLTGLQENTGYNVSVRAGTAVGPGPYSQAQSNITFTDGTIPHCVSNRDTSV